MLNVECGMQTAIPHSSFGIPHFPLYFNVCTSTDNTAGKSLAIGAQLSPESGEQYTCPPVVPK
jgi:hypothetical protein